MERHMALSDLVRMRVMRKKHRWKRTVTCPWKPPPMKINCVPKVAKTEALGGEGAFFFACIISVGYSNARYLFLQDGLGPLETTISRGTCRFTD
jgi:hypothetical protein